MVQDGDDDSYDYYMGRCTLMMIEMLNIVDDEDNGDDDGYDYYMGRCTGQESSSAVRRKVVRRRLSRTSAP